jgi:hypothetical protein
VVFLFKKTFALRFDLANIKIMLLGPRTNAQRKINHITIKNCETMSSKKIMKKLAKNNQNIYYLELMVGIGSFFYF